MHSSTYLPLPSERLLPLKLVRISNNILLPPIASLAVAKVRLLVLGRHARWMHPPSALPERGVLSLRGPDGPQLLSASSVHAAPADAGAAADNLTIRPQARAHSPAVLDYPLRAAAASSPLLHPAGAEHSWRRRLAQSW